MARKELTAIGYIVRSKKWRETNRETGPDSRFEIKVDLEDFFFGATKTITIEKNVICHHCHGHGSKLNEKKKCDNCGGKGTVSEDMHGGIGMMLDMMEVEVDCPVCKSRGFVAV